MIMNAIQQEKQDEQITKEKNDIKNNIFFFIIEKENATTTTNQSTLNKIISEAKISLFAQSASVLLKLLKLIVEYKTSKQTKQLLKPTIVDNFPFICKQDHEIHDYFVIFYDNSWQLCLLQYKYKTLSKHMMDERDSNCINDCQLHFSSGNNYQNVEIFLSIQTRSSGAFKFKIDGDALAFLQTQILGVQDIDQAVQALNNQGDIQYFCSFTTFSGIFTIFNNKQQYPIPFSKRSGEMKSTILVQKNIQIQQVCLKIVEIIKNINKEQFYNQSTTSIKERLIERLQPTPTLTQFSKQRLRAYFQRFWTKERERAKKKKISPTPRINQGLSESKQYIFHPTFVTVDMFRWILKDSPNNYLILGRSGMGKSSSCIFYSELTFRFQQILLKKKQYQLQKLVSYQILKIPKIVYISFREQKFDYYEEILNQLPKKKIDGKIEWTKSPNIFRQIKHFYNFHKINFKLIIDQVNIYSSFVREQRSCRDKQKIFKNKEILDDMQEIIQNSKFLSVIYCSSSNIERNYFIGSKHTSERTKVHSGTTDPAVKEVCIDYENYQNAYRGFVESINAIRFQLRLRCDQKERVDEIDQLILSKLASISKNTFEMADNYNSENILTFRVVNKLFLDKMPQILEFIEENKDKGQFLHVLLKYFKAQSLHKQIDKYSEFLRKGNQQQNYERLVIFEKLVNKARQIVKTQKRAETKFSFSLFVQNKDNYNLIDFTNMENTIIEQKSKEDSVKLTVLYPPQTFLYISRNIKREEQAYIKIIKEALNSIGGLTYKFGQVIDSIYSTLLSQQDSILTIGDQLFHITAQKLFFVHFSSNSFRKKEAILNYDIMRHFDKNIRALQQKPMKNNQYFGAYPALMPLSINGEWQEAQQSNYTNCSWCIDSLLFNKHQKQQGRYNIISLDFTAGNNAKKIFQKYGQSSRFFNILHEANTEQFQRLNIVHKIIVFEYHMSSLKKKIEECNEKIPKNVKIQYNSLQKFKFNFDNQEISIQRRMYKLIRKKLEETEVFGDKS